MDVEEITVHRPLKSSNQRLRERIDKAREEHGMSPLPWKNEEGSTRATEKMAAEKNEEADTMFVSHLRLPCCCSLKEHSFSGMFIML